MNTRNAMDLRSWHRGGRSVEKSPMSEKASNSCRKHDGVRAYDVQAQRAKKFEMKKNLKVLNEKRYASLDKANSENAEEVVAVAGMENGDADESSREELDKVLFGCKDAYEKKMRQLNAALRECMKQLRFIKEMQEKRVHGPFMRTSDDFEKIRTALEENLVDTSMKIAKLETENTRMLMVLSGKEKVIEHVRRHRDLLQADAHALKVGLKSSEEENASLRYEVLELRKELEFRNSDSEFSHRMVAAAQKKYQRSARKIAKLETECQRLRILVGKRFPRSTMLIKTKSELEMPGKDLVETQRKKPNPSLSGSMHSHVDLAPEVQKNQIQLLTEQLRTLKQKNKSLEDALYKKSRELQLSRSMYSLTASRLSRSEGQTSMGQSKCLKLLRENSLTVSSDIGSDRASSVECWASALMSELEYFKNEKKLEALSQCNMDTPSMHFTDDFADMKKVVSNPLSELGWLGKLTKMILHYTHVSNRSTQEVLEDMKAMLAHDIQEDSSGSRKKAIIHHSVSDDVAAQVSSSQKPLYPNASDAINCDSVPCTKMNDQRFTSDVHLSICKILNLLEGIRMQSQNNGVAVAYRNSGYMVRLFQWKYEELSLVVERFVKTCNALLAGRTDLEHFAHEVATNLEWIMSHCLSLQDVSSMKDAIRNHFHLDESRMDIDIFDEFKPTDNGSCAAEASSNPIKEGITVHIGHPKATHEETFKFHPAELEIIVENSPLHLESLKQCIPDNQNKMTDDLEHNNDSHTSMEVQLKEITCNQVLNHTNRSEKLLLNDQEIEATSNVPAECHHHTIIPSVKEIEEVASPSNGDAHLFFSPPGKKVVRKRSSLLDKMIAEDRDLFGSSPCTRNFADDETFSYYSKGKSPEFMYPYRSTPGGTFSTPLSQKIEDKGLFSKAFWRYLKDGDKRALIPSFLRSG